MKARAARLLVLCCITALTAATAASAGRPPFNPVCDGTKIEPVATGTYALPAGNIDITVRETPDGQVFDFDTGEAGFTVTSIVAKGGTAYATWDVNAPSGTDLHAPLNPHSGYWYDLSYLCIDASASAQG
jgi:hypothetical protein